MTRRSTEGRPARGRGLPKSLARRVLGLASRLRRPEAEIVICVRNAPALTATCLDSVRRTVQGRVAVTLVDDASDEETARLLRAVADRRGWRVIRNPARMGFVRSANIGLRAARGELRILLNSDTVVAGDWLPRLITCAARPGTGVAGPVSNAAGFQSVPRVFDEGGGFAVNALPPGTTPDWMAGVVADCAGQAEAVLPVVNGFCLAIPAAVQARVGLLDEAAFPLGYGEETDYALRCEEAGLENRIALGAYVHHHKRGSFTDVEHRLLTERNHAVLRRRYGDRLEAAMARCRASPELAALRARLADRLEAGEGTATDAAV